MMDKVAQHERICRQLHEIYVKKNKDYGDSFGETFREEGLAAARIRITDKTNRFKTLSRNLGVVPEVRDESIVDTLLDLANYAIMVAMELEKE